MPNKIDFSATEQDFGADTFEFVDKDGNVMASYPIAQLEAWIEKNEDLPECWESFQEFGVKYGFANRYHAYRIYYILEHDWEKVTERFYKAVEGVTS